MSALIAFLSNDRLQVVRLDLPGIVPGFSRPYELTFSWTVGPENQSDRP